MRSLSYPAIRVFYVWCPFISSRFCFRNSRIHHKSGTDQPSTNMSQCMSHYMRPVSSFASGNFCLSNLASLLKAMKNDSEQSSINHKALFIQDTTKKVCFLLRFRYLETPDPRAFSLAAGSSAASAGAPQVCI